MFNDINNVEKIKRRILEEDRTIRLWDFSKHGLSRKKRDYDFSSGSFKLSIIDPFNGVLNPYLISYESLKREETLSLVPTVLLDSNVMSLLDNFVSPTKRLSDDQRKVAVNLLDFFILEKMDFNPAFYYIESFAKLSNDGDELYIKKNIHSILTLHSMDELHFLLHREIKPDNKTLEIYKAEYGSMILDEIAYKILGSLQKTRAKNATNWKLFYLILLKAALIQKTNRDQNFTAKMNTLYDYIYEVFGVLFSREISIASFYFSEKLDKFIPFQEGANFNLAIKKFRASSWDIYLLRFPEILISSYLNPTPLASICTGDSSFQYIGRKFKVNKLISNKSNFYSEIEVDYSDMHNLRPGHDPLADLMKEYNDNRDAKRRNYDTSVVLEKLPEKITQLEEEIRLLCQ